MIDIVFDVGGVLIDWNPQHLYQKLIPNPAKRKFFLEQVCSPSWNAKQDLGRSWIVAENEAKKRHPEWANEISAYRGRWGEMVSGAVTGGFELMSDLHAYGHRVTGLSNWNHETFAEVKRRFPLLNLLEWTTVSGEVKLSKPDPAVYQLHATRLGVDARTIVFIDDNTANVEAAKALGWQGVLFTTAPAVRTELQDMGLI